ncbi:MAG: acyltransferase [Caulobacteraceae bacterium]
MTTATPRYGYPEPRPLRGFKNRLLQALARSAPGGAGMRARLHRARGVKIGHNVWIGYDSILETSRPWLIEIEDDVLIGVRTTIIAHFNGAQGVKIEKAAYIGPCSVILPNVVIGHGAVVAAGSVVSRSVAPLTVVQGNPAVPVSKISKPMGWMSMKAFAKQMRPIPPGDAGDPADAGAGG